MADKSDDLPWNKRLTLCPFDNTSFGINFQLERGNAGYVFDGIDTGSHTVTIELRGTPIGSKAEENPFMYPTVEWKSNKALVKANESDKNKMPPEMWICSDTYWTWSIADGVRYYSTGIPAGFE